MAEEHSTATIGAAAVASIRVTCDRRGCPAVAGASTPVFAGETTTAALARCRDIVGRRWYLSPELALCGPCYDRPGEHQPTLTGLVISGAGR